MIFLTPLLADTPTEEELSELRALGSREELTLEMEELYANEGTSSVNLQVAAAIDEAGNRYEEISVKTTGTMKFKGSRWYICG